MSSSNYSFWSETLNSSVTQGSLNAEVFSLITVNAFYKRIILSLDRSAFEGININPPSLTSEICNLLCPATCGRCTKKCKPLLLGLTLLGIDQVESCGVSDFICDYKICRRDFSHLLALFTKVYRANRMKGLLVKNKNYIFKPFFHKDNTQKYLNQGRKTVYFCMAVASFVKSKKMSLSRWSCLKLAIK